jgi:hypothetical protein
VLYPTMTPSEGVFSRAGPPAYTYNRPVTEGDATTEESEN